MISTGRIVKKSLLAKALLATLVAPIHAASDAGDNEVAELRGLVTELQRQVAQLQGESNQQWLTEQRAQEIRGLVQDVLADADTRASLLQSDAMAGWEPGRGFFIGSADGNYLLRFSGQIQIRAVYNRQEESPSDDSRFGFEARRVKIYFAGHVFDPSWQYEIELQNQRSGGAMELGENGWIQKDFGNGWTLRGGQLKPAYSREDSVSSRRLQSVERTLINTQFSAGTTQGLQVRYAADQWRVFASVHDGVRTANTSWSTQDTEYAMGGRAELLLMGDWKQMEHDIGFRDGEQSLLVGGAVHYERDEFGTALGPPPELLTTEEDTVGLTSDVTWKCQGGSIAAALYYRMRDADDAGLDVDQYGFFIRGGLFVMDDLELYAQYEWGDLDVDAIEELQVITLGVNKYWDKHNLKWQSDLGFAFDEVSSAWASDSSGWRADAPGEDGQIVVRTQVQLLF